VNANGTPRLATAMTSFLVVAVDSRLRGDKLRGNDAHGTEWVSAARMLSSSNGLGIMGELRRIILPRTWVNKPLGPRLSGSTRVARKQG
jgi:hypothetical protein